MDCSRWVVSAQLRWLSVTGTKVTSAGIAALEDKLPELEVTEDAKE